MLSPSALNPPIHQSDDAPKSLVTTQNKSLTKKDTFLSKKLSEEVGPGGSGSLLKLNANDARQLSKPLAQVTKTVPPLILHDQKEVENVDDTLLNSESIDTFFTLNDDDDELVHASAIIEDVEQRSPLHQMSARHGEDESRRTPDIASALLKCLDIVQPSEHMTILDPIEMNSREFVENDANTIALVTGPARTARSPVTTPGSNKLRAAAHHCKTVLDAVIDLESNPGATQSQQETGPPPCEAFSAPPSLPTVPNPARTITSPQVMPFLQLSDPKHKKRITAFSKAMVKGQQSQRSLQKWDKSMGLKKSHSSTMTATARSRKQLRKYLSMAKAEAKKSEKAAVNNEPGNAQVGRPRKQQITSMQPSHPTTRKAPAGVAQGGTSINKAMRRKILVKTLKQSLEWISSQEDIMMEL